MLGKNCLLRFNKTQKNKVCRDIYIAPYILDRPKGAPLAAHPLAAFSINIKKR